MRRISIFIGIVGGSVVGALVGTHSAETGIAASYFGGATLLIDWAYEAWSARSST